MALKITPELLADLKARAQKASPGNWFVTCSPRGCPIVNSVALDRYETNIAWCPDCRDGDANADYIAAANPAVVLALIADYECLEKEADWLATAQNMDVSEEEPTCCPEGKTPPDGCIGTQDCPQCWREAARKTVEVQR